jgi:hypothetical protein
MSQAGGSKRLESDVVAASLAVLALTMSATESGVQSAVLGCCDAAMGDTIISTVWVGLWQAVIHMHVQCEELAV